MDLQDVKQTFKVIAISKKLEGDKVVSTVNSQHDGPKLEFLLGPGAFLYTFCPCLSGLSPGSPDSSPVQRHAIVGRVNKRLS